MHCGKTLIPPLTTIHIHETEQEAGTPQQFTPITAGHLLFTKLTIPEPTAQSAVPGVSPERGY